MPLSALSAGTLSRNFLRDRITRSQADLAAAHKLILRLLDAAKARKLKVNQAKCATLVKLGGREAPSVLQSTHAGSLTPTESFSAIGGWVATNPGLPTAGKLRSRT